MFAEVNGVGVDGVSDESGPSAIVVGILEDLYIDPRKMEDYVLGHHHWSGILE